MSEHERRKSAESSRGEPEREPPSRAPGESEGEHSKHGGQPGGGRHSESEKPASPDSRWGGGRGGSGRS